MVSFIVLASLNKNDYYFCYYNNSSYYYCQVLFYIFSKYFFGYNILFLKKDGGVLPPSKCFLQVFHFQGILLSKAAVFAVGGHFVQPAQLTDRPEQNPSLAEKAPSKSCRGNTGGKGVDLLLPPFAVAALGAGFRDVLHVICPLSFSEYNSR